MPSFSHKTLLVIIPDSLSGLVKKGEITERYYNPGEVFDIVHLLLTNKDQPDPEIVQKMVGSARVFVHNLPFPSFRNSLGWQKHLLKSWVEDGVRLAMKVTPNLIRSHGIFESGYLGAEMRKHLRIPFLASLHTHPIEDMRKTVSWMSDFIQRFIFQRMMMFERKTLSSADMVLPVYQNLVEYCSRLGARNIQVCYNVVGSKSEYFKRTYRLHHPPRVISVGRQFAQKDPEHLIRAISTLCGVELTLIGDGPFHEKGRRVAREAGVSGRVSFLKTVSNEELCRMLPDFDIFAANIQFLGISKTTIEALLAGLPIIISRREGEAVVELQGPWVKLVENSPQGFGTAIHQLLQKHSERESMGIRGREYALKQFSPDKAELRYKEVYQAFLRGAP